MDDDGILLFGIGGATNGAEAVADISPLGATDLHIGGRAIGEVEDMGHAGGRHLVVAVGLQLAADLFKRSSQRVVRGG